MSLHHTKALASLITLLYTFILNFNRIFIIDNSTNFSSLIIPCFVHLFLTVFSTPSLLLPNDPRYSNTSDCSIHLISSCPSLLHTIIFSVLLYIPFLSLNLVTGKYYALPSAILMVRRHIHWLTDS